MKKIKYLEGTELFTTISTSLTKKDKNSETDQWSTLSNKSFAKDWDNDKDSVYDNWREKSHNLRERIH